VDGNEGAEGISKQFLEFVVLRLYGEEHPLLISSNELGLDMIPHQTTILSIARIRS